MANNPLGEVFGFPINNHSEEALRYRKGKLCPYNNRVPNCTKDKALDPLGVCSIFDESGGVTITCPIRFRENWIIAEDAATFFFEPGITWTSLTEVRLKDGTGQSAGNIDVVLVSYDQKGRLLDFGSLEVQGVYIYLAMSGILLQSIWKIRKIGKVGTESIIPEQITFHHQGNGLPPSCFIKVVFYMNGRKNKL